MEPRKKTVFDYSIVHNLYNRYILEYAKVKSLDKVLDAGCGIGFTTDEIARLGGSAIGVDINQDSIDFAKKNMQGSYMVGSIEKTPFMDKHFDTVVCSNVLEHIKDPIDVVNECKRVLKDSGVFVCMIPCFAGILKGGYLTELGHSEDVGGEFHYRHAFHFKELSELMNKAGFKIVNKRYFNFLFPEVITGLSKFYSFKIKKIRYKGQSDVYSLSNSSLFKFFKLIYPFLYGYSILEDWIFPRFFKGHMLVVKAVKI